MKINDLFESSDNMLMLGDTKRIADLLAKASNDKFKREGSSYKAKFSETKEQFSSLFIEKNKALKAIAAEGNSEYDRWNVKTNSGVVHILVYTQGIVCVTHEDLS
jgi:hypothetical protein